MNILNRIGQHTRFRDCIIMTVRTYCSYLQHHLSFIGANLPTLVRMTNLVHKICIFLPTVSKIMSTMCSEFFIITLVVCPFL